MFKVKPLMAINNFKPTIEIFGDNEIVIDKWISLTWKEGSINTRGIWGTIKSKQVLWSIQILKSYAGTRLDPPSVEEIDIASGLSLTDAYKKIWHLIIDNEVDCILDNIQYQQINEEI